jgi:hypothetical protein
MALQAPPPLPPDGYWYVIAYEGSGVGSPSTWGSGQNPVTWTKYNYVEPGPISGVEASGVVLNAQLQHQQRSPQKGAVRAWWWNNGQWVLQPGMSRDWGALGLSDAASVTQPPLPAALPSPGTVKQPQPKQAGAAGSAAWLWVPVIGIAGFMFWELVRTPRRPR